MPVVRPARLPRLAPAVITLIERDGEALLARGRTFPVPMYSCIARLRGARRDDGGGGPPRGARGGRRVDHRRALHRQPAVAVPALADDRVRGHVGGGDIVIDETEIVDAQWFRADDLPMIPPGMSIARSLIDRWLERAVRARLSARSGPFEPPAVREHPEPVTRPGWSGSLLS